MFEIFFMAAGLFSIVCALFDWDWFMTARRVRFVVRVFGRNGARIFYVLLGLGIMVFGALGMMGVVEL